MKKVRLFAVAAAMGMFASSVSAATQVGPVVEKNSGSFAWGEFASVMKVDMGDKVVAPQVSVTATTEGRSTNIDYATYKNSAGLTKTSTCYVGFTNKVGKDTNIDGLNDTPLYIINGENGGNTDLTYFSSVDDAITYWANAGESLYGTKILAVGSSEVENVYTVAGSTKSFDDLEDVFDYLVEEESIVVEKNADGFISKVVFGTKDYYEVNADGTTDTTRPTGTISLAYSCDVTRGKAETYVKQAIADLFVSNSATQHTSYDTLKAYSIDTVSHKALYVQSTQTTLASTNTLVDYYYPTSVTKGEADNYLGHFDADDIAHYGAVLVTEYDSKYDVYVPENDMTAMINDIINSVVDVEDDYEALRETIADYTTGDYADADALIAALTGSLHKTFIAGKITAGQSLANAQAEVAALDSDDLADLEKLAVKSTYTTISGTPSLLATFNKIFAGNQDTANKAWTAVSANTTSGTSLRNLFLYAGLDYEPTANNVKNTFIKPGFVSMVEYDADRHQEEDFVVTSYPKVQNSIKTKYTTIQDNYFDIVDTTWTKSDRLATEVATEVTTNIGAFAVTFPATTMIERDSAADIDADDYIARWGDADASIEAGELSLGVYLANAPENTSDYIVINLPSTDLNPYSQSRTKGTATYRSLVTGEEIMTHFVELQDVNARTTHWYPAVDSIDEAKEFLRIALGIYTPGASTPITASDYITAIRGDFDYVKVKTWINDEKTYYWPANVLADVSAEQCTYSTLKGADSKTEAASVSFDASKVDTTKAGVYTATLTAKAGETTETKDVTVVVAPKYSRTWDNKGRVSTLKAYWLSGNLYAEYKYTYNADNTITVVSTFYREDGVTVADTATTTK